MRAGTIATPFYAPAPPPQDPKDLPAYLREEFAKIAAAVQVLAAGHVDMIYAAPAKPRDGDVRLADGTSWNPGSGQGFYGYRGGAWHLLG